MAGASKTIVIDAPPETVFDVLTAYEEYPEYLPEAKSVKTSGSTARRRAGSGMAHAKTGSSWKARLRVVMMSGTSSRVAVQTLGAVTVAAIGLPSPGAGTPGVCRHPRGVRAGLTS